MDVKSHKKIIELSERAPLLQLIEECGEAAQAAAKLLRVLDGENPTPVTEAEAREHLCEEAADVWLAIWSLKELDMDKVNHYIEEKRERWIQRLSEPHADPENTARWVYDPNGIDWGLGAWKCSKCGAKNDNLTGRTQQRILLFAGSKFCPQCGRRIVGVQDPEEGGKA